MLSFHSPRALVLFALISALSGEVRGRTRYQRTAPLRRRSRTLNHLSLAFVRFASV